jgi:putative endopeptidase
VEQLQADYPAMNWKEYFNLIGTPQVEWVILTEPKVMAVANDLMTKLTEQQMRDYMAGILIKSSANYLSDAFGETSFDFYGRTLSGSKERQPRWKRALGFPNSLLGEAVGEIYVNKYFAHGSKEKMMKLINELRKSLAAHIAGLTWMSEQTKINALVKLNAFTVKIGYPDKWRDYSGLQVDPSKSLYENIKAASLYETRRNLDKMGKPVDKDEWGMTPQTVNAYYNPTTNEICFPAAILQPPFFNMKADEAANYGAIGVVIGHELTHGFDDQGRQYDENGNLNDWWTDEDAKNFDNNKKALIDAFNACVALDDPEYGGLIHGNGELTLGENIADNGGLHVSYLAMQNAMKKDQVNKEKMDNFTPEQRFFLAYAAVWASNIRPAAALQLTQMDVHSLGRNRVNVALPQVTEFIEAFGIKEGDGMWLAPEKRVVLW